jgi:chemotaxis protein histidine kinase CheA
LDIMSLPIVRAIVIVFTLTAWVTPSRAAASPGDAEARKLITPAMEIDFLGENFDAAEIKLNRAEELCKRKACSPSVFASIYGYFAIISWVAGHDKDGAIKDLQSMLQINPKQKLDDAYAPEDMTPLFKKAQALARTSEPLQEPKSSAPEPEERRPSAAEQRAADARAAAEEARAAEQERKEAATRAAEERREAARSAAEEKRRAAEDKKEAARIAAEEKKEAQRQAAEDARSAAAEKKEAARAAAEEKKEAARIALEEARQAAEEKKEAARKAAEEKKEAALKAAEEKKEAARKVAEEKKEAKLKAAEDARKAAEEKKAEAARKAEEARVAEIDKRMKTPPPVGKLVEEPWKGQALGYPVLVRVKLPPPPPKVEPERVAVVKVVTEFSGPGVPVPGKIELKPNKEGAYEGGLPCDVTKQEGEVSYYTTAYNKYDNVVASSGSVNKPNQVQIKAEFASRLAHMPGELPPISCEESERRAKAAAPKETAAAAATAPVCEGADCGGTTQLPTVKPGGRGCLRCVLGPANPSMDWEAMASLAVAVGYFVRRRTRCVPLR